MGRFGFLGEHIDQLPMGRGRMIEDEGLEPYFPVPIRSTFQELPIGCSLHSRSIAGEFPLRKKCPAQVDRPSDRSVDAENVWPSVFQRVSARRRPRWRSGNFFPMENLLNLNQLILTWINWTFQEPLFFVKPCFSATNRSIKNHL